MHAKYLNCAAWQLGKSMHEGCPRPVVALVAQHLDDGGRLNPSPRTANVGCTMHRQPFTWRCIVQPTFAVLGA
eukprot:2458607-Pyramimonas_sp.AAC.1